MFTFSSVDVRFSTVMGTLTNITASMCMHLDESPSCDTFMPSSKNSIGYLCTGFSAAEMIVYEDMKCRGSTGY